MGLVKKKPAKGSIKNRKRKGRGNASGMGGECGRGHKGQKSRSGYSRLMGFEGGQVPLYKRIPKRRGAKNRVINKILYVVLNLGKIDAFFNEGDSVDLEAMKSRGLIGKNEKVKILGEGELTKKITIKAHKISKSAKEKIDNSKSVYEEIK
ncbi:MAG: 50S ribosomal protein L15 [bacterium]|nr:50S ribosomal protein L15 [bacterium]